MEGTDDMQLPRKGKLEWNLNTILNLLTLVGMLAGGVYIWANTTRDIEDLMKWRLSHEDYHKERLAETRAREASVNERLRAEEVRGNDVDRKIDNLTYRVTVAEQSAVSITSSIKDLQAGFNKQASDIQVVKEILQRMEAAQQGRPSR
ncbi:hypothetical protein J2T08_002983 [Neorhizobium galegae]|uniref:hypothetical protein n=1 Tax=Neorhizobium galegae TaxID=399 RepID=UPI0027829277|nr:hypothetical protein [Neorhizobium galegae]MDQ0135062.1 hypothetical protein [Neorhizobium galegae]